MDKQIFENIEKTFDSDQEKNRFTHVNMALTVGVVVDTDDPLQQNRLRIFCPSLNDDPKKILHLPWASYVSPFSGVIDNSCFVRGSNPESCKTEGAVHYGFWATLEKGAHALVGCIDGDPRRRFWLGAFPSHQETHTLFNGRFKWNDFSGTPDGPFSSSNNPIQPLYDNITKQFVDRESAEYKTRGADYQATAVDQNNGQVPNSEKSTYLDEQYNQISSAEPDQWVKDILGAHGYDWTSFKNLGGFLTSKVFGMTTPGFHSLMMDDRAFNNRIKLRSTSGHLLLMDDTNERIYIATNQGNNWIEMDSNGNIDIFTNRRLSVHAKKDINFSTDESFRVTAKKGIFMYSGNTPSTLGSDIPPDGEIRIHASKDLHVISDQNIRQKSLQNTFIESVADIDVKSNNYNLESNNYNLKSSNINIVGSSNIKIGVSNSKLELDGSSAIIDAGSKFQVNSSSISSDASSDVFFKGGAIQGSINSINSSFLAKQNGSGSPLISAVGPSIDSVSLPTINVDASDAKISVWTNRVPEHEPWPRTMKQSADKPVNQNNNGYMNNVDWINQFDNTTSPDGRQPIGKVEGDEVIERGIFWRR